MCADCARDYADPSNHRFHAEPIACPRCGPKLNVPIADVASLLREGGIVALKGLGGFHLLCDARDEAAVANLRRRKARDAKALLKNTVTITRGREAFVSQHIGDLDDRETIRFRDETISHLTSILEVEPQCAVCDLHPDFVSTRSANPSGLPVIAVQHHVAHVAAVVAERRWSGAVLGVALDGHGYGANGAPWGGELIMLDGARWARVGALEPLALPGGDRAAREPWRMGVAMLHRLGRLDQVSRDSPRHARRGAALRRPLARRALRQNDKPGAPVRRRGRAGRRLPPPGL